MVFDQFEPIGTRTTPDLLSLLISQYMNVHRKQGSRVWLPQDILGDPSLPPRLSAQEEAHRTGAIAADYRRLRAERLASMEKVKSGDSEE